MKHCLYKEKIVHFEIIAHFFKTNRITWKNQETKRKAKKPFQLLNLLIFHITLSFAPTLLVFDHSTRESEKSLFGWKWGGRKMRCDIWQNFLLYKFCFHSLMTLKTIFSLIPLTTLCRVVSQAEKLIFRCNV